MSPLLRCLFIATLASCIGCEQSAESPAKNAAEESASQLPRVELVRPVRKDLIRTTTQPATIHPYYQADIVAKVSGYFRDVNVDIGDEVMEGQPLCTLIIPEMNQQREQAVARQRRL
ncbi:MAG: Multidrug resistance protein MdtA precursor, partial [Planctomycetota bacterium]